MAKQITGRVEVLVNGEMLLNKPGAVARGIWISGQPAMSRKAVVGDSGPHGLVEEPVIPECEVKVTDRSDISLSAFAELDDCTVVFRAARSGKSYTMEGAWLANPIDLTAGEGESTLLFQGPYWTETEID